MPKIIEGLREKILSATKTMLLAEGYDGLSLRGVAKKCRIAVGTIYNYFDSKSSLVANAIMEDWSKALRKMTDAIQKSQTPVEGICGIYDPLKEFYDIYVETWEDFSETGHPTEKGRVRHTQLREEIAEKIQLVRDKFQLELTREESLLLAENILLFAKNKDLSRKLMEKFINKLI